MPNVIASKLLRIHIFSIKIVSIPTLIAHETGDEAK